MAHKPQMQSLRLFSLILDELLRLGGEVLRSEVVARTLKKIGVQIGEQAHAQYRLSARQLSSDGKPAEYVHALKNFSLWPCDLVSIEPEEVVLDVAECPFGSSAVENPQYCNFTSGFFGGLAARHFGQAKVNVVPGEGCPSHHCRIHILTGSLVHSPSRAGDIFVAPSDEPDQINWRGESLPLLHPLTPREISILGLVGEGLTAKEIAASIHSSVRTIENTIYRISSKLDIRGRAKLIRFALRHSIANAHPQEGQLKKRTLPDKNDRRR